MFYYNIFILCKKIKYIKLKSEVENFINKKNNSFEFLFMFHLIYTKKS